MHIQNKRPRSSKDQTVFDLLKDTPTAIKAVPHTGGGNILVTALVLGGVQLDITLVA